MTSWTPNNEWSGSDVFIIGGGPSLADFDWSKLRGKRSIGCNAAFLLGGGVCSICFFSDIGWWEAFKHKLEEYAGRVVTHCPELIASRPTPVWLQQVERRDAGLHNDAVGFNGNSGASAVNLALLMGARRVILLGFDCKLVNGQSNWHDNAIEPPNPLVYDKFMEGWRNIAADLPTVFPGREILNATPNSAIPFFPKVQLSDVI